MKKLKWAIVIGIAAIILLTTFDLKNNVSTKPAPETKPVVGFTAPDFTLQTLNGKTVKLSDFRGKPVYVNFWASWCPPCKEEIPEIQKFYQQYKDRVVVLGVNITFNDKLEDVRNIMQADHANYPVLLDTDGDHGAAALYQVDGIPASFFIDKDGVIRDQHVGAMTFDMLQDSIRKAM